MQFRLSVGRYLLVLTFFFGTLRIAHAQTVPPGNYPPYPVWQNDNTRLQPVWWRPAPYQSRAPEPPPRRTSYTGDRLALLAHVGIGAPAGALGVSLDLAPVRWFAINVGVGLGSAGTQFAATPRLRIEASKQVLFGIGTGVSFGPYTSRHPHEGLSGWLDLSGPQSARLEWRRAYWHNVEFSLDYYPRSGVFMSHFAVGYGYVINEGDRVCIDADKPELWFELGHDCGRTGWKSLVFVSAAIGFDI